MTVLPLMARVTTRLGLGTSLSTTFNRPYPFARARLDRPAEQRTGGMECRDLGERLRSAQLRHGCDSTQGRYALRSGRRESWRRVCPLGLLGYDVMVLDRASGVFADTSKVRYANYEGRYVARAARFRPAQPTRKASDLAGGSSPRGRGFAAAGPRSSFARMPPSRMRCLSR